MGLFDWLKKSETQVEKKGYTPGQGLFSSLAPFGGQLEGTLSIQHVTPWQAYEFQRTVAPLATVIDKIIKNAEMVEPVLTDGDSIQTDHPALELLHEPGFGASYKEFLSDYLNSVLLTNEAFMHLVGPVAGAPKSLEIIPPQNVMVIEDNSGGYAQSYDVMKANSSISFRKADNSWRYIAGPLNELAHYKRSANANTLRGDSPLNAIRIELEQRLFAAIFNKTFLQNGAALSGALNSEVPLDDSVKQGMAAALQNFQGPGKAGKVMILDGGKVQFIDMTGKPRDMNFDELLNMCEKAIAGRYDVPLPLMTTDTMTFSNLETAYIKFWEDCILPLMDNTFSTWSRTILPRFKVNPRKLHFTYNPKTIAALRAKGILQAEKMQKTYVFSDNEIRASVGYEDYPGGDAIYKPQGLISAGQDRDKEADSAIALNKAAFIESCKTQGIDRIEAEKIWNTRT